MLLLLLHLLLWLLSCLLCQLRVCFLPVLVLVRCLCGGGGTLCPLLFTLLPCLTYAAFRFCLPSSKGACASLLVVATTCSGGALTLLSRQDRVQVLMTDLNGVQPKLAPRATFPGHEWALCVPPRGVIFAFLFLLRLVCGDHRACAGVDPGATEDIRISLKIFQIFSSFKLVRGTTKGALRASIGDHIFCHFLSYHVFREIFRCST